jgi:hypothetical protein
MFDKVREAIDNAIANGFDPLVQDARSLAEDLIEKTGEFAEDTIEVVTDVVEQVKQQFDKGE